MQPSKQPERRRFSLKNKRIQFVRYGLLATSIALITVGLAKQEHLEAMQKAVKICLECIGIG